MQKKTEEQRHETNEQLRIYDREMLIKISNSKQLSSKHRKKQRQENREFVYEMIEHLHITKILQELHSDLGRNFDEFALRR